MVISWPCICVFVSTTEFASSFCQFFFFFCPNPAFEFLTLFWPLTPESPACSSRFSACRVSHSLFLSQRMTSQSFPRDARGTFPLDTASEKVTGVISLCLLISAKCNMLPGSHRSPVSCVCSCHWALAAFAPPPHPHLIHSLLASHVVPKDSSSVFWTIYTPPFHVSLC